MINGDFTGLPKVSYYFTSEEGQPRKKMYVCVCMYTNVYMYKHIQIIHVYKIHMFVVYIHVTIY